jgi:hypothetical protein
VISGRIAVHLLHERLAHVDAPICSLLLREVDDHALCL